MSSSVTGKGCARRFPRAVAVLILAAGWSATALAGEDPAAAFDAERAWSWLVRQCELGPRQPGSEGHAALQDLIVAHAESLGLSAARLPFQLDDPYGPGQLELCNLVVPVGPRGGERLWLGAHYDTRPRCERDPDPARRDEPLIGANDGASGVAILLHLLELLAGTPPPRGVDLLFLDGEDYGREGDLAFYCLGSQRLSGTWRDFGSPLAAGEPEGLIILDMVGKRNLVVPMELYSLQMAPALTRRVFERAAALGLGAFVPQPGPAVYDDHIPFLRAGIPAVDLIDFAYPEWHTTADLPAACSAASLGEVGRLVADLAYHPGH